FLGKGTITTADGRKFDFEIEVQYSDQITAAAGQHSANTVPAQGASGKPTSAGTAGSTGQANSANSNGLPTVQFPNVDFPGTLADLFQLIGRNLQSSLSVNPGGDQGNGNNIDRTTLRNLSLRLLSLVDSKHKDTYSPANGAETRAKSVADAYGTPSAATDPAQSATAAAPVTAAPTATTTATTSATAAPANVPAATTDASASAATADANSPASTALAA
ncbi:MAG: hypothetical protein V4578_02650, partial [Pseudomonadota bacterium]